MTTRIPNDRRARVLRTSTEEQLTQAEIAERHGISQPTVHRIEKAAGKRRRSFSDSATGFRGNRGDSGKPKR